MSTILFPGQLMPYRTTYAQILQERQRQAELRNRIRRRAEDENADFFLDEPDPPSEPTNESSSEPQGPASHSCWITIFLLCFSNNIPVGFLTCFPIILQNYGISYKQQAGFVLIYLPFTLKVFWAPVVDTYYNKKLGRRKSWIVPVQCLMAAMLIFIGLNIEKWLGQAASAAHDESGDPNLKLLSFSFLILNILLATHSIAVDGWSVSILQPSASKFHGVCSTAGSTFGVFFGYVAFMTLEASGLVSLSEFLLLCGFIVSVIVVFIAFFKQENHENVPARQRREGEDEPSSQPSEEGENPQQASRSILKSYKVLLNLIKQKHFQDVAWLLLTVRITFAPHEAAAALKLAEMGVDRSLIVFLVIPVLCLQALLPLLISNIIKQHCPFSVMLRVFPFRVLVLMLCLCITFIAPNFLSSHNFSYQFYVLLMVIFSLLQLLVAISFVAVVAIFTRISNPEAGGTVMTFLHTVNNLGRIWPTAVAFWMLDYFHINVCHKSGDDSSLIWDLLRFRICFTQHQTQTCWDNGGECLLMVDGYFIESVACLIFGLFWMRWAKRTVENLQKIPQRDWYKTD